MKASDFIKAAAAMAGLIAILLAADFYQGHEENKRMADLVAIHNNSQNGEQP